jgi:hypothetical protein
VATTTTTITTTTTTTTTTIARIQITLASLVQGVLTVYVTNVGNVNILLTQITLSRGSTIVCQYPVNQWISPGQTRTFSYSCGGVTFGLTYTVTVTGQAPDGTPVTAQTQVTAT